MTRSRGFLLTSNAITSGYFGGSRSATCKFIAFRATCLGTGCPIRCVTTLLASGDNSRSGIRVRVTGYVSVNVRILPPSVGRSLISFAPRKHGVLFNLSTIHGINLNTVRYVVGAQSRNKPFGSLTRLYSHISLRTIGHHTLRSLVLTKTLSALRPGHGRLVRSLDLIVS